MRREFNPEDYVEYVTSESFKTGDSTDEYQYYLQGIVDYPMFIQSFFKYLPGAVKFYLNEKIKLEIDKDR